MSVSREQAAEALRDIERVEGRSATLRGYQAAAPHLMLWGVLWFVGYGLTHLMPERAGAIWFVVVAAGFAAGTAASLRRRGGRFAARYAAITAALAAFVIATIMVMAPVDQRQVAAFIPLVVAISYVLAGIWAGTRYVVAGIAVAALTLAGFFLLRQYFLMWMAVVGGGALLLAGVWLRRA